MLVDLNARRAAMAAAGKEPKMVVVGDPPQQFQLVDEVPLVLFELLDQRDMAATCKILLADESQWPQFSRLVTMDDLGAILDAYGTSLGESSESPSSFPTTGEGSPQTSAGSTVSTSADASLAVAADPPTPSA